MTSHGMCTCATGCACNPMSDPGAFGDDCSCWCHTQPEPLPSPADASLDRLLIWAFRAQPPEVSVVDALRQAILGVFSGLDEQAMANEIYRHQLMESVPELRAAQFSEYRRSIDLLATLVGERIGVDPDDFELRAFSGALVGVLLSGRMADAEAYDATAPDAEPAPAR